MILMNRLIETFQNIILASIVRQNHILFSSIILINDDFSNEAIDYIKKKYYKSENAQMFMKYYIYNYNNLYQIIISQNKRSYIIYWNKIIIISKFIKIYFQYHIHQKKWIIWLRNCYMNKGVFVWWKSVNLD